VNEKKRLSYDEILQGMEEIARDPDDRDRFKALKALAASQSASMVLPDPLDRGERVERLARLMKGCGPEEVRLGFRRAFPTTPRGPDAAPDFQEEDLTPEEISYCHRITSARMLHKYFPELNQAGFPKGAPRKGGLELRANWYRRQAIKIMLDRKHKQACEEEASQVSRQIQESEASSEGPKSTPSSPSPGTPPPSSNS
jgi:hypothetical protein